MDSFLVADTEDNSPDLEKRNRSGFEKVVTQVAAIGPNGEPFYFRPKVKRRVKRYGFVQNLMDMEPFYNWLVNQGHHRCYFHNTRYDLGNIFPSWIACPERGAVPFDELDISMVGNRLISAKWRNITFLDSFNLWPMALKKVGKAVGIEKQEMNVRSRSYVDNDCRIVRKAIQTVQKLCAEFEINLPASLGSLCVAIWLAIGGQNWHWTDDLSREAYYGGRVELFQPGGYGDILYTDINSLYPYCMTLAYGMGAQEWLGIGKTKCEDLLRGAGTPRTPAGYGIATVTLEVPKSTITPLPVERPDGSIYYPYGKIQGTYTLHEIRNALEHGTRLIKVHQSYGSQNGWPYYRKFVKQFYQRRKMVLPGGPNEDPGLALFIKLLLNNLYGQLGMSGLVTRSLVLDRWIERDALDNPVLLPDGQPKLKRDGVPYGKKLLAEIQMPLPAHANYLHAAYVTSYARLVLQKFMRKVPERDLIYCDTDSLFFFSQGFKPPFPIGNELGQMKLEAECSWCECQGPKMYSVKTKGKTYYKAKGIPNRKDLPKTFMEKGVVSFLQPYGLRETIRYYDRQFTRNRKGEALPVLSTWHEVEKRKLAEYDRKRLTKKGTRSYYEPIANTEA